MLVAAMDMSSILHDVAQTECGSKSALSAEQGTNRQLAKPACILQSVHRGICISVFGLRLLLAYVNDQERPSDGRGAQKSTDPRHAQIGSEYGCGWEDPALAALQHSLQRPGRRAEMVDPRTFR